MARFLARLDAQGLDDPDNNEGFIGDRCNVCEWPMIDHPARGGAAAKWPHRRHAAANLICDWLDRTLARISGIR